MKRVDTFFDEQAPGGVVRPDGLLGQSLGTRLFGVGAYVGEVLRRTLGGSWDGDDADPDAEINISLVLPNGTRIWPVQRAVKRYQNGPIDGIADYCSVLGLDVKSTEPPKRKRFGR